MSDPIDTAWNSYGKLWAKLHCTACGQDVSMFRLPESGTVLACAPGCHFIERSDLDELDQHLPEASDCDSPLADLDTGELICHPWEFVEDDE